MIKINEIFHSIQGESTWAGWPTVFIRTSGCHLRCTYCDTTYAYHDGEKITLEDIITKVQSFNCHHVCLTGGEPLLQNECLELMTKLCDLGHSVSLETSGAISCDHVDPRVKKIIDVKTPDSGEPNTFNISNLPGEKPQLHVNTEYKFVLCSEDDFYWAEDFSMKHELHKKHIVLYSPSFGKIDEKWLAKKILFENSNARLQLQLHKYIWSPNEKGV